MKQPLILAIDTSCDETCAAVSYGRKILSNVISSQINIHAQYGGVVPHLAKRAHEAKIGRVVKEALTRSHLVSKQGATFLKNIDALAVTVGPGLAPALEVGISYAKNLALKLTKPLIAVNHMEGHLLSCLAERNTPGPNTPGVKEVHTPGVNSPGVHKPGLEPSFPALGLLASGGHTQLVLVKSIGSYKLLGETLDDAAGEALDKLAKMLKLGYPGGPIIEQLAKLGNPNTIPLPIPLQHSKDFNFSFSGLKTAAMYIIQKSNPFKPGVKPACAGREVHTPGLELESEPSFIYNMCASFQQAIAASLAIKLQKAIDQYSPKTILLGGGVFSNLYFRRQIRSVAKQHSLPLYLPCCKKLFTDNAAMIGVAASFRFNKGESFVKNIRVLDRQPNLNF